MAKKPKMKVRIPVCKFDEEEQSWKIKNLPSHAASKQVENGEAVYPVEGTCPVDPPIMVEETE